MQCEDDVTPRMATGRDFEIDWTQTESIGEAIMEKVCSRCGNILKPADDCPKTSKFEPCHQCRDDQGRRTCRRRGPHRGVCLCCNRSYMRELYPTIKSKEHRRKRPATTIKDLEILDQGGSGGVILVDASGDVVVRWKPARRDQEALYWGPEQIDAAVEWLQDARARRRVTKAPSRSPAPRSESRTSPRQ